MREELFPKLIFRILAPICKIQLFKRLQICLKVLSEDNWDSVALRMYYTMFVVIYNLFYHRHVFFFFFNSILIVNISVFLSWVLPIAKIISVFFCIKNFQIAKYVQHKKNLVTLLLSLVENAVESKQIFIILRLGDWIIKYSTFKCSLFSFLSSFFQSVAVAIYSYCLHYCPQHLLAFFQ